MIGLYVFLKRFGGWTKDELDRLTLRQLQRVTEKTNELLKQLPPRW